MLATDFSPAAKHALEHAATIAARHGAALHIVHGQVLFSAIVEPEDEVAEELAAYERALARVSEARLAAQQPRVQAGSARDGDARTIKRHLVRGINAAEAVLDAASSLEVDLIVVGTHARSALSRALLGSVAAEIVRASTVPVLVVGPGKTHAVRGVEYTSLLCPTDFSPNSAHAIEYAARLARRASASLIAVHVTKDWSHPAVYLFGAESLHAAFPDNELRGRQRLAEQLAPVRDAGLEVIDIVAEGPAHRKIVEYARAHDAQLIVMSVSNASPLDLVLIGSVTNRVLRTAPCPVLVVPPATGA